MRTLIAMVGMMLGFSASAQPIQRQFFTTNTNPRVIVAAGTNVTVQYTTTGPDIRTYTVNSAGGGGTQTNISYTAVTNAPWQWGSQNLTNWSQLNTSNVPINITGNAATASVATNLAGGSTNQVYTQTGWSGYPQVTNLSLWTNGIGTAIVPSLWLTNPTPAALGAQQASPALMLGGQGWRSGNSTTYPVQMGFYALPVQGSSANPTAQLIPISSIAGTAPAALAGSHWDSDGTLNAQNGIFVAEARAGGLYGFHAASSSWLTSQQDGHWLMANNTGTGFTLLLLGCGSPPSAGQSAYLGSTTNWPAIRVESGGVGNYPMIGLRCGTNALAGIYASLVASNVTATATLFANSITSTNGGTVGGAVLSTSSTTNSPANTELATAGWVRGLFNNGVLDYATTNVDVTATNIGVPTQVYTFATTIPDPASRSYANPTNGQYIGSVITTNTFQFLQGPISVNAYMALSSGGSDAATVHPEIYYSYDKTNWYGDWEANNQSIAKGVTNLYQWVISFPSITATNTAGFYIERRFKVGTQAGTPTITFLVGTNTASGTNNASHIAFTGPSSQLGDAFLAANQTFTGSNQFSGGMMIWGDANKTNGVLISPAGEILSNAVGSVTITGGNVTAKEVITPPVTIYQSSTNLIVDMTAGSYQLLSATNDLYLTAANITAGASILVDISAGTTNRAVSFDTNFVWLSTTPTTLTSNKVLWVSLTASTTATNAIRIASVTQP